MKFPSGLIIYILAACLTIVSFSSAADAVPPAKMAFKVGLYENFPKVYTDKNGRAKGLFPDILHHIARQEGWTLTWVPGTWAQCLQRLTSDEIDIMVDVALSAERLKHYDFNDESLLTNWGILYTRKGYRLESFIDLEKKKIAVMAGSIHTDGENGIQNLLKRFSVTAQFVLQDSYKDVFSAVESGQADCGVVNRIFGRLHATDFDLTPTSIIFNPRQLKFAFPKGHPQNRFLITAIDRHLRQLKQDPNSPYQKSLDAYLSGQPRQWTDSDRQQNTQKVYLTSAEKEWIQNHPIILFAIDPEFHPFEYIAEDGTYAGITSDYIKIMKERLGINLVRVENLEWKEAMQRVKHGDIDLLPCVGKTQKRLNFLKFSRGYLQFQRVIITRTDIAFITGIADISHLRVVVQKNTSHEGFLLENTAVIPQRTETLQAALLAVAGGKADAVISNIASASYWIRKLNLTNLKIAAPVTSDVLNLHIAVRKDWPELVTIINKGLQSVSSEEENRIFQKWVQVKYTRGIDPARVWKYVIRIGGAALLLLLGVFAWNYRLKKEINRRKKIEKKMQYRSAFDNLLSDISSRFIATAPERINQDVDAAMAAIAEFTLADYVGLFGFDDRQEIFSCTHLWLSDAVPDLRNRLLNIELRQTPWWFEKIRAAETISVDSIDNLPAEAEQIHRFIKDQGIHSFIDVPRLDRDQVIGFFRMGSVEDRHHWTGHDIELLKLGGQILTHTLLRMEAQGALKNQAIELRTANQRLQELDQLKSMFIASMSHELRTPLNSIIGFTSVILQGMSGEINDRQTDQLQRVYQSAKHLLNLITDVIDISKIEAGRIDIYAESVDFAELAAEAQTSIQALLDTKKQLTLTMEIEKDLRIYTDRKRLLQCLINLLSNAVKYTEDGRVELSAGLQNGKVEIKVRDTGIGIAEKDLPKLFEPFERLESHLRVKAGGTGLGLYLTRKLATEILQGALTFHSRPGEGSTFILTIPKEVKTDNPVPKNLKPQGK